MNNLPKALTRQECELKRFVELSWNFCKCMTLDLLFNPWKCCLKTSSHIFKISPSLTYNFFSIRIPFPVCILVNAMFFVNCGPQVCV